MISEALDLRSSVVNVARSRIGCPYRFKSEDAEFDENGSFQAGNCFVFTSWVFNWLGIWHLRLGIKQQKMAGIPVLSRSIFVRVCDGDLIFGQGRQEEGHVGIIVCERPTTVIHASCTHACVVEENLFQFLRRHPDPCIRRIV